MQSAGYSNIADSAVSPADFPGMGSSLYEPSWYAAYTNANHEKSVSKQLEQRSVEHFLPLYESVRAWKDRRVRLQMPLFPGYIFVKMALLHRLQVLQVPGVVYLVGFNGHPTPVPQEDIEVVRACLDRGSKLEPHPYLRIGRRVQVRSGPLKGLEGTILRRKNKVRFVLSFELILRSMAVEIDEIDIAPGS